MKVIEKVVKAICDASSYDCEDTYEFYEGNGGSCSPESVAQVAIDALDCEDLLELYNIKKCAIKSL